MNEIKNRQFSKQRIYLEQQHVKLSMVYLGVALLIPIAFTIDDMLSGRLPLVWTNGLAFLIILLGIHQVYKNRKDGTWKQPVIMAFLLGFPFAVVAPHSRFIEMLVVIAFFPIAFQLAGPKKGLGWAGAFIFEIVVLVLLASLEIIPNWMAKYPWPLITVLGASVTILFALSWNTSHLHKKAFAELMRHTFHNPDSGLPTEAVLLSKIGEAQTSHQWVVGIHLVNHNFLSKIMGSSWLETLPQKIRQALHPWPKFCIYHIRPDIMILVFPEHHPDILDLRNELEQIVFQNELRYIRFKVYLKAMDVTPGSFDGDALNMLINRVMNRETKDNGTRNLSLSQQLLIEGHSLVCTNIQQQNYTLWYQPIFPSGNNSQPAWYEGLGRLKNPQGNMESIQNYLEIIQDAGLLRDFTLQAIQHARMFCNSMGVRVSINLQLSDLEDRAVLEELESTIDRVPGGMIILELLETDPFWNSSQAYDTLRYLRKLGYKIALDDFGSGHANLGAVWQLELDIIKIDGNLAKSALDNSSARKLIQAVIPYCKSIGVQTVVEKVETPEAYAFYQKQGVDFIQGYYLGTPVAFDLVSPDKLNTAVSS